MSESDSGSGGGACGGGDSAGGGGGGGGGGGSEGGGRCPVDLLTPMPNPMYKSQRQGKVLDSSRLQLAFRVDRARLPDLVRRFEEWARRPADVPIVQVHADCVFFNGEFPRVFSALGHFTDLAPMVRAAAALVRLGACVRGRSSVCMRARS